MDLRLQSWKWYRWREIMLWNFMQSTRVNHFSREYNTSFCTFSIHNEECELWNENFMWLKFIIFQDVQEFDLCERYRFTFIGWMTHWNMGKLSDKEAWKSNIKENEVHSHSWLLKFSTVHISKTCFYSIHFSIVSSYYSTWLLYKKITTKFCIHFVFPPF